VTLTDAPDYFFSLGPFLTPDADRFRTGDNYRTNDLKAVVFLSSV